MNNTVNIRRKHTNSFLIGQRYEVRGLLGAGGMGEVYRAFDHAAGTEVALKRMLRDLFLVNEDGALQDLRLQLATEFQTLAALRHPSVIQVLDYGFDAEHYPYFTMELLDHAQTFAAATAHQPRTVVLELLIQAFQALWYLHRRGILHHDLKPENLLVQDGRLRVLDFGLAVMRDQPRDHDSFGTFPYMPPEVLHGEAFTQVSDFYAMGVMAYEVLVGHHPFAAEDISAMLQRILYESPDLSMFDHDPMLQRVLAGLLHADPRQRYQQADHVIADLYQVLGQPEPPEDLMVRDSVLQRATFVGRHAQLHTLERSLQAAHRGLGSCWLIGGESGVGKSRLVEELRIRALVSGAVVVTGQAAEAGGPYQIWREPLRRFVLTSELRDTEAALVRLVLPDAPLLEETHGSAGVLPTPDQVQQQLVALIVELCLSACDTDPPQPMVLILEDLHWAGDSLEPLRQLSAQLAHVPLLVVGTYRDDEQPTLPQLLSSAHVMALKRFDQQTTRDLTVAMLGEQGDQPDVVAFVRRESEGNAFFMVEVVRTLAEDAGKLSLVGQKTLPQHIFAGGMQQLVRHRLGRVPVAFRSLLGLCAIAGRQFDQHLLHSLWSQLNPAYDRDAWAATCVQLAVLENIEGQFRFAHDKFRDGLIADIDPILRPTWYHLVAETLEQPEFQTYQHDERLVELWRVAEQPEREVQAIIRVAQQLIQLAADYTRAQALAERGLACCQQYPELIEYRMHLLQLLGDAYEHSGALEAARQVYQESLQIALQLVHQPGQADAWLRLGWIAEALHESTQALQAFHQSLQGYQQINHQRGMAYALNGLGNLWIDRGQLGQARNYYQQALALRQAIGDQWGVASTLNNLGNIAVDYGDLAEAQRSFEAALAIRRQLNDLHGVAMSLDSLGQMLVLLDQHQQAYTYQLESMAIFQRTGNRMGLASNLINLGTTLLGLKQFDPAKLYALEGVRLFEDLGEQYGMAVGKIVLSQIAEAQGDWSIAQTVALEAVRVFIAIDDRQELALAYNQLGFVYQRMLLHESAYACFYRAVHLALPLTLTPVIYEALIGITALAAHHQQWEQVGQLVPMLRWYAPTSAVDRRGWMLQLVLQAAPVPFLATEAGLDAETVVAGLYQLLTAPAEQATMNLDRLIVAEG